ncbi:MAG: serine/threonine-protein kinase [Propionibacteriaceae bacterium]|nr:serine/threonine-protein kinase [Propionibacteriaceae bacterium]
MTDTIWAGASGDGPPAMQRHWPAELNSRFANPVFRGQGGMGRVWAAYDLRTQRHVAVKVLREDVGQYAESRRRFSEEAARMQHVPRHDHVIDVFDFGTIGDWCFLTMPLLSGPHVGERALPVPIILRVIEQTADGLAHLHRHQLVHRDVKPSNLVFDGDRIRIVDFGIAKAIDVTPITKASVGTDGYMAPELLDPRNAVTPACDIYALGCVLVKLLTGGLPRDGMHEDDSIPPGLRALVRQMLAKDPAARPLATTVRDEMQSLLSETIAVGTVPGQGFHFTPQSGSGTPNQSVAGLVAPDQTPAAHAEGRTRIVPVQQAQPMHHEPPNATMIAPPGVPHTPTAPTPTAIAPPELIAPAALPEPAGPVRTFAREWLTARGHFGRDKVAPVAVGVAAGAWLAISLGGGWLLALVLLFLLRLVGVR